MFKNIVLGSLVAVMVIALGVSAVTPAAAAGNGYGGNGNGNGLPSGGIVTTAVSADEAAALTFMREEEKLARDVYTKLYELWGQAVFQNIAASEQTHMDALGVLLSRYGLTDPAQAPGIFTNATLQGLYDQLVVQGSQSLAAALKVGAAIEEIDILDLQTRLAQTTHADIQQVFTNLMNGSYNHLRAFSNTLSTLTGETYAPQTMTAEQYNASIGDSGYPGSQTMAVTGNKGRGRWAR